MRYVAESGAIIEQHDWVDPEAAFAPFATTQNAIWLDSSDTHHPKARYSFILIEPYAHFTLMPHQAHQLQATLRDIRDLCARHKSLWDGLPPAIDAIAPPFRGGMAGLFAYDLGSYDLGSDPHHTNPDTPLLVLGVYASVLAFDHTHKNCFIIATGLPATTPAMRADAAHRAIAQWRQRLTGLPDTPLPPPAAAPPLARLPQSNFTAQTYQAKVQQIIDHILAGDIFQANLAQCFTAELNVRDNAFHYYQRLRRMAGAPFACFAQFGDWAVASASPERFLFCKAQRIESHPIKGTRPRGTNLAEDAALATALAACEKDRAENIMIVDLLRNDLAKTCRDGSIAVPDICRLEHFSNVHHLVSVVRGHLRDDKTPLDALLAAFPGGSITGAPKKRAMEIIAAYEPRPRGMSYGSIGYIGFDGTLDSNIIIRTAFIRGRQVQFHVGGGIVADSHPQTEYEESISKARDLHAALGVAMGGAHDTKHGTKQAIS